MIPRDRVLTALRRGQPDRVPFLEAAVDSEIQRRLMGRDDFSPAELAESLGLDGFCVDMTPPIFARREWRSGKEFVLDGLIRSPDDLDLVQFPDPDDESLYAEAMRTVRSFRGDYAVGLRIRLGASATFMSMGMDGFAYALVDFPGLVEEVLGRFARWTSRVLEHVRELGVDFIWSFDDVAYKTGPLVSPRVLREVILPCLQPAVDAIHATGLPWILHSDGNLMPVLPDLLALGFDALHPIEPGAMDIAEVKRRYGDRICIAGNIDLHHTLTRGTPQEVECEVRQRIEVIGKGGGYILSSANSITNYCKAENVLAMRDAVARYGWYA